MTSLRRTLLAGLWGVPGPVLAGLAIAGSAAWMDGKLEAFDVWDLQPVLVYLLIPLIEGCFGLSFGLVRTKLLADSPCHHLDRLEGAFTGAFVWFLFSPLMTSCMCASPALEIAGLAMLPGLAIHVVGGAIAGFHVEHFLATDRSNDEH